MTDASDTPRNIFFSARLSPHRSLSPRGFRRIMLAVGAASMIISAGTYFAGAWPVFGFMGLDVALVYLALSASFRRGRMTEFIELDDHALTVERTDPSGQRRNWRLQPAWLRVELGEPVRPDTPLVLRTHGQALAIGAFLGPNERRDVAKSLAGALDRWRRGYSFSPSTSRIE